MLKNPLYRFAVAGLIIAAFLPAHAQSAGEARVRSELLVSTDWLAQHLSDPHLVIIHAGRNEKDYSTAHIPGARFLAWDKFVDEHSPLATELLPMEELKKNFEAIGVSDDSRIVIYAPEWDPQAARVFFTLDYLGLGDHAALLDGGIKQWFNEKRPYTSALPAIKPGHLTVHEHSEIVVKMAKIQKIVAGQNGESRAVLIDARPEQRYRDGHISGAAPLYWQKMQVSEDHPVLRSPEELRAMFREAGATPGRQVISYCGVGQQASYTYFVARYLGLDAAMYDGSMHEWSMMHEQPVVKGDKR
jgi:thiosulfate/3-mercaptopyruvate sulfurtransferase